MSEDWEPLLPDDRVGRIAEMLRFAVPSLPRDAEVFTFVVPPQVVRNRGDRFPHERGCPYAVGPDGDIGGHPYDIECDCGPFTVPEQAVFAIKTDHPRTWDPMYQGKKLMSQAGMLRSVWEAQEKHNRHFVSPREDPAFNVFLITARQHVKKIRDYRELI